MCACVVCFACVCVQVLVIRNGQEQGVSIHELVVGDILILGAGGVNVHESLFSVTLDPSDIVRG